ncbi:MAG TPA: hypothetical protein H9787_03530 [Candidatus Oscillibacter excrementigallinarum]|uniref:DUF6680 domain-containing protein n=1 Tax=Candidatus Oscillibacter excrementigallinarum TaxID=2838716 RepID=A0A9D2RQT9_9FIRM|nr:hypothetical protein [Candidatus Oscillibacter excrementigallinarum]
MEIFWIFSLALREKGARKAITTFEIIMAVLNLIAALPIPVIAVIVGQYLQERELRRKDKMDIFRMLMMNQVG